MPTSAEKLKEVPLSAQCSIHYRHANVMPEKGLIETLSLSVLSNSTPSYSYTGSSGLLYRIHLQATTPSARL